MLIITNIELITIPQTLILMDLVDLLFIFFKNLIIPSFAASCPLIDKLIYILSVPVIFINLKYSSFASFSAICPPKLECCEPNSFFKPSYLCIEPFPIKKFKILLDISISKSERLNLLFVYIPLTVFKFFKRLYLQSFAFIKAVFQKLFGKYIQKKNNSKSKNTNQRNLFFRLFDRIIYKIRFNFFYSRAIDPYCNNFRLYCARLSIARANLSIVMSITAIILFFIKFIIQLKKHGII